MSGEKKMEKYRRKHSLDEMLTHEAKISSTKARRILRFSNQKAKKVYVKKLKKILMKNNCMFVENKSLSENEVETRKEFDARYNQYVYAIFTR